MSLDAIQQQQAQEIGKDFASEDSVKCAQLLSQAMIPINTADYHDFLSAVKDAESKNAGDHPRTSLQLEGGFATVHSKEFHPDYVIVQPNQTLLTIAQKELAQQVTQPTERQITHAVDSIMSQNAQLKAHGGKVKPGDAVQLPFGSL